MKIQVSIEELRKKSIFIGVPMYGGQCTGHFCKSVCDLMILCTKYGINVKMYYLFNESLVQRARNYICDEFMRSEFTHLLFIDSDIAFDAKDVISLLGIATHDPEKYKILTAPYPKKDIAWEKVRKAALQQKDGDSPYDLVKYTADYVFNPIQGVDSFSLNDPVEVSEAGTGFMLISREVFEKYNEWHPEKMFIPDHVRSENFDGSREVMAYFDCGIDPDTKRYLSEDYYFCYTVRNMGIGIHMCPWMKLQHVGSYVYSGSMEHLASLGMSPTASNESKRGHYK